MAAPKVIITGASGFIGRALGAKLIQNSWPVGGVSRVESLSRIPDGIIPLSWPVDQSSGWETMLDGFDTVVHLAARVHVMNRVSQNSLALCRATNTEATANLARAAACAGVRRFVYVSSIKVNGEKTSPREFFKEVDKPNPQDAYAQSKWEAEQLLVQIAREYRLEVIVLRPPLVYGPEVRANFLQLLKVVDKGIPLPFADINNRRSLLYIGNFVSAIEHCIVHPAAVGQTFLLSDGEDASTSTLIADLARAMGRPPRLFKASAPLLRGLAALLGKKEAAARLLDSLCVDSSKIRQITGWQPPFSIQQGLEETVEWYLRRQS